MGGGFGGLYFGGQDYLGRKLFPVSGCVCTNYSQKEIRYGDVRQGGSSLSIVFNSTLK